MCVGHYLVNIGHTFSMKQHNPASFGIREIVRQCAAGLQEAPPASTAPVSRLQLQPSLLGVPMVSHMTSLVLISTCGVMPPAPPGPPVAPPPQLPLATVQPGVIGRLIDPVNLDAVCHDGRVHHAWGLTRACART